MLGSLAHGAFFNEPHIFSSGRGDFLRAAAHFFTRAPRFFSRRARSLIHRAHFLLATARQPTRATPRLRGQTNRVSLANTPR